MFLALSILGLCGQSAIENRSFDLIDNKSSFVLVESGYATKDFRLRVSIKCVRPGRILDTVGIDSAPKGSWCLEVTQDRRIAFYLWDGAAWHITVSSNQLGQSGESSIEVVRREDQVTLSVDGLISGRLTQSTELSGRRVYVGDYKGDERFGKNYEIYKAMTGRVQVQYFGLPSVTATVGSVFRSGQTMYFYHPDSKLYMTARFNGIGVDVLCATQSMEAPRSFRADLARSSEEGPSAIATFEGGGGGEVHVRFDTAGRLATTFWKPRQGPSKWMVWARVASVGSTRLATPDEIDVLNGGSR